MRRTYKQSVSKRDKIEFEKTLHDSYKHPMTISFDLGDDYEIDITAVPPEDDEQEGYVDAVLFLGGQEVCVCEVGHELEGRYYFTDADDKEICLIVE